MSPIEARGIINTHKQTFANIPFDYVTAADQLGHQILFSSSAASRAFAKRAPLSIDKNIPR